MARDAELFEAWRVPAWDDGGAPEVATRVLPPARTRAGETPDAALAVPELRAAHAAALARRLREARDALLAPSAREVAAALGRVGARLAADGDPLRRRALALLPATTGLSGPMCEAVLDGMARDWTAERLERLVVDDLGDPAVLDGFVEVAPGLRRRAVGASLGLHLAAGSVPGVSATSLVRSLLARTPVVVKPGRGDVALPVLLLHGLAEEAPALARAAAVLYWPGGDPAWREVETVLLEEAEVVVAYGGDDTVRELRARLDPTTRLVAYHHRLSFGVVGAGSLGPGALPETAEAAARAVALFDQRGCVSPHTLFVEADAAGASDLAAALADALEVLDRALPPGRIAAAEASAVQQLRGTAEMRAAAGEGVEIRSGGGTSPWTVVVEPDGELVPSCLNRVVRVVPVASLDEVAPRVERRGRHLQTVGYAGVEGDALERLADALARTGALRVVPLERVPFPPAWWRHDGRGPLEALVRWVELEG